VAVEEDLTPTPNGMFNSKTLPSFFHHRRNWIPITSVSTIKMNFNLAGTNLQVWVPF
jgi:hypothetical protein